MDGYVALLARLIEDNEPALVVARADRLVARNTVAVVSSRIHITDGKPSQTGIS